MTKIVRSHCHYCGPDRNAEIVANYETSFSDDDDGHVFKTEHLILRCMGCNEVYYRREWKSLNEFSKPTFFYWPPPSKRKLPAWSRDLMGADWDLYGLVTETYIALDNDAHVLAAIGLRTVFDRASEKLGVDPALQFDQKLDALFKMGKIGQSEKETLAILTDAGGAAAHRGWKPTVEQLDTLMTVGEQFLYRTIILEGQVKALKPKIPPRQKRKG